jgi:hypothetical protein
LSTGVNDSAIAVRQDFPFRRAAGVARNERRIDHARYGYCRGERASFARPMCPSPQSKEAEVHIGDHGHEQQKQAEAVNYVEGDQAAMGGDSMIPSSPIRNQNLTIGGLCCARFSFRKLGRR